jgi:hypothetical protein
MLKVNHYGQIEAGPQLSQKHFYIRIFVAVCLGAMLLAVFGLSGCGSDSTPAGVKGKNPPPATKSGSMNSQAVTPRLADQEAYSAGKKGFVKKQPDSKNIEVFPGVTLEEVEATMAASRTKLPIEVFPGVTSDEVEATMAANRINLPVEVFPGVTLAEVEAKMTASRTNRPIEVFPGITLAEVEAKMAANRTNLPMELFPGKGK